MSVATSNLVTNKLNYFKVLFGNLRVLLVFELEGGSFDYCGEPIEQCQNIAKHTG